MNNYTERNIELLDEQIIATIIFIGTLIVSLFLTYDEKQELVDAPKLFTTKQSQNIALINRIIVVILGIYFLYNSYENEKLAINQNQEVKYLKLQTVSSWFGLIGSVIVLYVIIRNYGDKTFNVSQVENPTL